MSTPNEAAADSRFSTAVIAGMSRLRKASTSSRKLKPDDRGEEPGQLGACHRREVVEGGGQAAHVDPQRGAVRVARYDGVPQSGDQGGGGLGFGRRGGEDLGHLDRRPGRWPGLRGPGLHGGHPRDGGERAVEPVERGAVGRGPGLGDQEQRAVEARPEPVGEHLVRLVGGARRGVVGRVGEAQPQVQHGERTPRASPRAAAAASTAGNRAHGARPACPHAATAPSA